MDIVTVTRLVVFAAFVVAALVATGSWLIRTRRVSPFGPLGRGLRASTDFFIRPVESKILRWGGNPVNAGWWLVIGVAIVGVLLIAFMGWLQDTLRTTQWAVNSGPRAVISLIVSAAYTVVIVSLFVRVIGSWFGFGPYTRWMRPAYALTDWIVKPIRRALPPAGMFDLSPLVALLALWLLRFFVSMVLGV